MRFRKSIKVVPGVRVNLSKTGVSTSVGVRGATVNLSTRGVRSTISVPGSGLSWSSITGWAEIEKSRPADEIENLRNAAVASMEEVEKEAEKLTKIETVVNRAIGTLNGGRGLTVSKVQTFEKRVLTEEKKLIDIENNVHERRMFLDAIGQRLEKMKFGIFAGGKKSYRDKVVEAVVGCVTEAKGIENQISSAHQALLEKLAEIKDQLGSTVNGK